MNKMNWNSNKDRRSHIDLFIIIFDDYLQHQKGLSLSYRRRVCKIARLFLDQKFGTQSVRVCQIKPMDIVNFILQYSKHGSPYRTRNMESALRAFLRYIKDQNMIKVDFSPMVPPVAIWKMDRIPDYLSRKEINLLLKHIDRNTLKGRRNYAIIRLLSCLGLRAFEIAALTLDDFDWANGIITIKGKGSKISQLPLMQDLGEDLVAYLLKERPSCSSRSFFLSLKRPQGLKPESISRIVKVALQSAGLRDKGGAHLLRHSLGTLLINKGASFQQIAMILRHENINTTTIYAKVDFKKLRLLTLPWPLKLQLGGET